MKLTALLELDAPLPADPYERLLRLHALWAQLSETTFRTMSSIYPDYAEVMDRLMVQLTKSETMTHASSQRGEA